MDILDRIRQTVSDNPIVLFMKGTPQFPMCGFSSRAAQALKTSGANFESVNVLEDPQVSLPADTRRWIELAPYRAVLAVPFSATGRVIGAFAMVDRIVRDDVPNYDLWGYVHPSQRRRGIGGALFRHNLARIEARVAIEDPGGEVLMRAHADDPEIAAGDLSPPAGPAGPGLLAGIVLRDNVRFRKRIEHFYRYAIAQAKREIVIANAYFVPGVALQRSLLRAAKRGVKITLLLQGRYEYFMQHHTSRAMYGVMLDAGIEIIEYAPSFLHCKVAVFDGRHGGLATVGSSNLDPLSLLLAREANIFVRDDAFGAELRAHLLEAVKNGGERVEKTAHIARPIIHRTLAWLAYGAMRFALFATRHRY